MPKLLSLVICMAGVTWLTVLAASLIRARGWTLPGMMIASGNRENLPECTPFAGRAERTAKNTMENFVFFSAIALVAQIAGTVNVSVLHGAELFFWARLVYIPVYWIGIAYVRTAVWAVSMAGLGIMLSAMF